MYFGDCKAVEPIRNLTLCVKEGNEIRNVKNKLDFMRENIVLVNNVAKVGQEDIFEILVGEMVRYKKVHERLI